MTIGIIGVGNIGGVLARDGRVDGIDDGLVESRWHLVDAIGFDPLDAGTIGGRGANSAVRPCTSKTPTSRERVAQFVRRTQRVRRSGALRRRAPAPMSRPRSRHA